MFRYRLATRITVYPQEIQRFADDNEVEITTTLAITDFGKAPMNALKTIFPEIEINGCYFHLKQCLMRRLTNAGFKTRYCKLRGSPILGRKQYNNVT